MALIHKFKQGDNFFVLDVNTGAVHIVDELVYDLVDDNELRSKERAYKKNLELNMVKKLYQKLMKNYTQLVLNMIMLIILRLWTELCREVLMTWAAACCSD